MITAYVGIGANLDDPKAQVERAFTALSQLPDTSLCQTSSLWQSRPMGPQDQPDYINAVAELHTQLAPLTLLDALQAIEQQQGRVRKRHWGERTLDLDILLYGEQSIDLPRLRVPHYGMKEREFVLLPLAEIAVGLILPDDTSLVELVGRCAQNGISRVER